MKWVTVALGSVALVVVVTLGWAPGPSRGEDIMGEDGKWRALSPEEARVIVEKGTERPFTSPLLVEDGTGVFQCRRCGAALFDSQAKFDSRSGWPSFDEALPGAVRELPDADGRRTEIVCGQCGGHLGHVFRGEGMTEKDTRHCVNGVALDFVPRTEALAVAYFAGGCFWGVEHLFAAVPGVVEAVSGYMGGAMAAPTYEEVCGGDTGHAETVAVHYDPQQVSYETLARFFFEIHDPTQVNRQGPDVGDQYRSAVFVRDASERAVVEGLLAQLRAKGLAVATEIASAETFWPAEAYHQDYYKRTGKAPYCHAWVPRFD